VVFQAQAENQSRRRRVLNEQILHTNEEKLLFSTSANTLPKHKLSPTVVVTGTTVDQELTVQQITASSG